MCVLRNKILAFHCATFIAEQRILHPWITKFYVQNFVSGVLLVRLGPRLCFSSFVFYSYGLLLKTKKLDGANYLKYFCYENSKAVLLALEVEIGIFWMF